MRYRVGETASQAYANSADVVTFTVVLTCLIGIGFVIAGIRAKQIWLTFWGGLSVIAAIAYAILV